ncbi:hypothetical protein E2P84_36575 [Burkholderia cepacia]|uniref:hypothetical protein n=1 Tax=Burkholderia cepacia TaxID=292 RepID=UPI001067FFDC|nr:hypothetical protein [Burkholderia cepacia]TES65646.1 hypothetical protein E2P84_36575 [Burkholderia cepacia]
MITDIIVSSSDFMAPTGAAVAPVRLPTSAISALSLAAQGFQHTSVSRDLFHDFTEIARLGTSYWLCNGLTPEKRYDRFALASAIFAPGNCVQFADPLHRPRRAMPNYSPRKYKSSPRDLLKFIDMLDLWSVPRFNVENQEIVVATTTWTGVLNTPRPMATLYIAGKLAHQEFSGTIVLIDDTDRDAEPGAIELRLEGRPYHEFNPNQRWAPTIEKSYNVPNGGAIVQEVREVIATHWADTWFTTVPFDQR